MKNAFIYLLMSLFSLPLVAQQEEKSSYDKEKLESAKVAFITQRLDLTPDQAEKFWPLYNQHSKSKRSLMRELNEVQKSGEEQMSDQEVVETIKRRFDIEQKILDLDKAFLNNIIKVITPRQAFKLDEVNKDFARHIYRMQKRNKED